MKILCFLNLLQKSKRDLRKDVSFVRKDELWQIPKLPLYSSTEPPPTDYEIYYRIKKVVRKVLNNDETVGSCIKRTDIRFTCHQTGGQTSEFMAL